MLRILLLLTSSSSLTLGFTSLPYECCISAEFPYESKYVDVLDSRMHYVEEGDGTAILLVHGNPTSSYLWRNVIPHLVPYGRVIAVDLIGMGKSGKPALEGNANITYTIQEHAMYLDAFVETMGLGDMYLVLHDWGGAIGLNHAMQFQERILGIAFMEAMIMPWLPFNQSGHSEALGNFFELLRGEQGYELVMEQNFFVEVGIISGILRPLTQEEHDAYRAPFVDPPSRLPSYTFPNSIPIGGYPEDVHKLVKSNYEELQQAQNIPVLLITVSPGEILSKTMVEDISSSIPRTEIVDIGYGGHYLQETSPRRVGETVAKWLEKIGAQK